LTEEHEGIEKLEADNDKLKDKWSDVLTKYTEAKEMKLQDAESETTKSKIRTVRFSYIVFRSMDGLEHVLDAYKVGCCDRFFTMNLGCCCPERRAKLKKKHFFKRWPDLDVACDPDNIKWFNLGTTANDRRLRSLLVWIVAFLLIFASLVGIILMKNETIALKKEFSSTYACDGDIT